MYARGDEVVVRGALACTVTRDGEVVGPHHPDGSPPYDVRRADNGRVTLYVPEPDAYVRHLTHARVPVDAAAHAPETGADHVRTQ